MGALMDLIARNRFKIGVGFLALWGVLQVNPGYQEWKKATNFNLFVNDLCVAAAGYIAAAGKHKSDQYQRDIQGKP